MIEFVITNLFHHFWIYQVNPKERLEAIAGSRTYASSGAGTLGKVSAVTKDKVRTNKGTCVQKATSPVGFEAVPHLAPNSSSTGSNTGSRLSPHEI
jgi:hypothetical protein